MKWLDDMKDQLPMKHMQSVMTQIKTTIGSKMTKVPDPALAEAESVMKRIHYLLEEKSSLDLGKQEIYKRTIAKKNGMTQNCTYIVDFTNSNQVKRLRTVLLELADLSSPDSSKAKRDSISGYLDYIAEASA